MLPNPVKSYRQQMGYSINELSEQSGISRSVIIRAEQGCYAAIPYRLHSYLVSREKRHLSYGKLPRRLPAFYAGIHPFIHWRDQVNLRRIEVAKYFCVHLSTLARFENNIAQQTVPDQLIEALLDSGYSIELIEDLKTRYTLYRNLILARTSGSPERIAKAESAALDYGKAQAA
jgi:hypothetical protein